MESRSERKPRTILVVDDEPQIRKLLNVSLSMHGFHVIEKENGRAAWEHIEQNECSGLDVIVTDVAMPELDGLALASRVVERCPHIPVVLMSAHANTPTVQLAAPSHIWMFVP